MADRKAELELKKERLKRMREEKVRNGMNNSMNTCSSLYLHRNEDDVKKSSKMQKKLREVFVVPKEFRAWPQVQPLVLPRLALTTRK